ncbi:unnamed protein product [Nyctereutes procyonoides]|uniref:(raccoon dog) hypothetical protein n=1 Tax=Nyctereutes procyonoides TaxID=34880 RepID=A0A811ZQV6_NYCPR|nr:unnamed protein product [Nyctereutes procyonoides]
MANSTYNNHEQNFSEEALEEKSVILTLVPANEEFNEEQMEVDKVCHPQISEQFKFCPRLSCCCSTPVPPLPVSLPPVNNVRWDTKIEVYLRLQKHAYLEINQECEAKLESCSGKCKMVTKKARIWKGFKKSKREAVQVAQQFSTAFSPGCMLVAWSRIAARVSQSKSVNSHSIPGSVETFLLQASGIGWCVVHRRPLLANTQVWVHLQFPAGQAWMPDTPKRMISLFLLPTCTFPSPGLEDHMLFPECAKRNKKMMKRLIAMRKKR